MKILAFTAENIKKVSLVEIAPGDEPVVEVTGANAQGKSSALDALGWLFLKKNGIDGDPIRSGSDKAVIEANLGDFVVRKVLRRSKDGFNQTLTVEAANGSNFKSPQQVIDGFMGALTLDPVAFMGAKPKDQFDMLRGFVPDVDFDKVESDNKADYDARTLVNRDIQRLRAAAGAVPTMPADLPAEPIDESALIEQMTNAAQINAGIAEEQASRGRQEETKALRLRLAAEGREKAKEYLRLAEEADEASVANERMAAGIARDLEALPPLASPVDVSDVAAQITKAREVNQWVALCKERDRLSAEADDKAWEAEGLTEQIKERNERKRAAIAAAKMPVAGLDFGDDVVLLHGHPINQASTAEQLRVSVAIAMASNPGLRVVRIKDGNSLDEHSMRLLREMAVERDFQVWIERVDTSGKVGFVIEEGRVISTPAQRSLEMDGVF